MIAPIRIGCSGWSYPHWRGPFYPADLPEPKWFEYYARIFDTVEVNNSFYQLPSAATIASWRRKAPQGFLFAVKASRYLSHKKKLKGAAPALRQFLRRVQGLGPALGPILYQLPPRWHCDLDRLREFLALLPPGAAHVFEFRELSWLQDPVLAALDRAGSSICCHDLVPMPRLAVGRLAYVRFHGTGPKYSGGYAPSALNSWARWLVAQAQGGRPAFAYFNNDAGGQAVVDALALRRKVSALLAG